ncbi:hypothetical protein ABZ746_28675 [Streptomyces sp. NPDC020096]
MPPTSGPTTSVTQLAADAATLRRSLRAVDCKDPDALAERITAAQDAATRALSLYLQHQRRSTGPSGARVHAVDRLAQAAKCAQDATAALTCALARHAENQRRGTESGPVIHIGPSPWQHVHAAADLLQRIPALCNEADHWLATPKGDHHAPATPASQPAVTRTR